jgi:hypothetical protein
MRYRVSNKLRLAVLQARCNGKRQYEIAREADNLHPVVFSSLINDSRPVRPDDPRVLAIGKVLGLAPEDCFERIDR